MRTVKMITHSAKETMAIGRKVSRHLNKGDIICLIGDLGTGKTTLTKGIAAGLKIDSDRVHSPTFVCLHSYEGRIPLYHFDLYRIDQLDQLIGIGIEEFLFGKGVAVVEWAEKLKALTPKEYLRVRMSHRKDQGRQITLSAQGKKYETVLRRLKESQ